MSDTKPLERHVAGLPADWRVMPIGELGSVIGGSTPSRAVSRYWNGDLPWVTPGELTGLATKYLGETRDHITKAGLESCGARLLPEEALLVTSRATIGSVALVRQPTATNQGFKSIIFGRDSEPGFYYHLFQRILPELERRASGTTFLEISGSEFCAVRIPAPALAEQRRIAEILDTLDEAIRKTEQLIAKLRQVKQGLLHDLLTRGVDDNGELRNPARHPEEFKDSRMGPIPVNWVVERLGDLVEDHRAGIYKDRGEYGSGANIVGVADLFRHESIDGQVFRRVRLSDSERAEFSLRTGDLIYAESSLVLDGIAKTLAVTAQGAGTAFAWHTRRLSVRRGRADAEYLALSLGSPRSRAYAVTRATQTAITGIPVSEYLATPLSLPPLNAQKQMVEIVRAHDARTRKELALAEKLRILKQGLMEDLLTGNVRVAALLGETTA